MTPLAVTRDQLERLQAELVRLAELDRWTRRFSLSSSLSRL
jgi:hypothetical protein